MNVPVREFKARLSRYIRAAHSGKDVVITSRGKAVARLTPMDAAPLSESPSREELVRKLKTIPGIRIGTGEKLSGSRNPIKIRPGEKTMSDIVIEGRGPR
jgi:prevent-host-death family protein